MIGKNGGQIIVTGGKINNIGTNPHKKIFHVCWGIFVTSLKIFMAIHLRWTHPVPPLIAIKISQWGVEY